MIPPALPAILRAALDQKAQGLSRSDATARAAAISQTYRGGGGSGAIRNESDALAYALTRMPATYAAIVASLDALREIRPEFAPASLLDVGAGPGTAIWAAAQAFDTLSDFAAIDVNPALRRLALDLVHDDARLSALRYAEVEASSGLRDAAGADLVLASYVLGELSADRLAALTDLMWAATRDTLLVVEPGTPAGYRRILDLRRRLITQGAHVIAPCPHNHECPLKAFSEQKTAPDWCHFVQRLPRSRAHKHIKNAELPFEDEKFSYVVLARTPARHHPARVLTPPLVSKSGMRIKLCLPDGNASVATFPRRDKTAYARVRRLGWGDTVEVTES